MTNSIEKANEFFAIRDLFDRQSSKGVEYLEASGLTVHDGMVDGDYNHVAEVSGNGVFFMVHELSKAITHANSIEKQPIRFECIG
jgi:hypothetical protein